MRRGQLSSIQLSQLIQYSLYISISFIISYIYHYILRILRLQTPQHFKDERVSASRLHMRLASPYSPRRTHLLILLTNSKVIQFKGFAPSLYLVSLDSPSRITHISHRYIVIFGLAPTAFFQGSIYLFYASSTAISHLFSTGFSSMSRIYASLCYLQLTSLKYSSSFSQTSGSDDICYVSHVHLDLPLVHRYDYQDSQSNYPIWSTLPRFEIALFSLHRETFAL